MKFSKVISDGLWLLIKRSVSSLSVFILTVALANILSKESYGDYKYIISAVSILSIFTLYGLNTALTQAVARGMEGSYKKIVRVKMQWGLIGSVIGFLASAYYFFSGDLIISASFAVVSIFIPLFETFLLYDFYLQGKRKFKESARFSIISHIIVSSLVLVFLLLTKNIIIILLSYFTAWTLVRYIFFRLTLINKDENFSEDPQSISQGKRLSLAGSVTVLATYADRLILFNFLGPLMVAVYSVSVLFQDQINNFSRIIQELGLPYFSSQTSREIEIDLKMILLLSLLIGLILALLLILLIPAIFTFLFPEYVEAIFPAQLISLTSIVILPRMILEAAVRSKLTILPRYILYRLSLLSLVSLIVMFIAVLTYGLMGAIFASIFYSFARTLLSLINWREVLNIDA